MRRTMAPVLELHAKEGAHDCMARLGAVDAEAAWRVQLPEVADAIEQMSLNFAESTNATTSRAIGDAMAELREQLREGILEGPNTLADLTKRVSAVFDQADQVRARRIAETESSRAVHAGQKIAAQQSGMVSGFRPLVSADACPLCQSIAAEHSAGVAFGTAMHDDGQGGPYSAAEFPPFHPHCTCTVTEVLKPLDEQAPGIGWAQEA